MRNRPTARLSVEQLESRELLAVYYVSPNGSDTASGDASAPLLTIQRAANLVSAGDTVNVRAGNYTGFVLGYDFVTSGTASAPIVFQADPDAAPGSVVIVARNNKTAVGIDIEPGCNYVTVAGFVIDGAQIGSGVVKYGIKATGNYDAVLNNTVKNLGNVVAGIHINGADGVRVEGNTVYGTTALGNPLKGHGIYIANGDGYVVRGNTIHDNEFIGLHVNGDPNVVSNALIENNVIYNNGKAGINCDGLTDSVVRNNLIYGYTSYGISMYQIDAGSPSSNNLIVNNTIAAPASGADAAIRIKNGGTGNTVRNNVLLGGSGVFLSTSADSLSGLVSDYNVVGSLYRNDDTGSTTSLSAWRTSSGQDAHSIVATATQLFANAAGGDFHLKSGSLGIDAGTATGAPVTDFEGTSRPSGAGYDIGFDEYQSSSQGASQFEVNAPATATAGGSFTVTVTARDSSGNVATGYTGTVRFTSNDAQATLPANYTFVAGDAGVKTFNVTLKTSGSRTVVATDTMTGSITGTATSTVSAAAASTVTVSAPATATAGTSFTTTVTAKDAYGNTATGYTGTVRFTSNDAQATLPANYTFVAGDAGVKSFSVTLKTAGARTVTATDTVTAAISGSASSTVSAAAASAVQLSAPATATAGAAFTVTATAKDAYGNTATGYRGTVNFTSTDTQATLPANYTFTTADAGVKSFTVTLRTAGARSVTVTDTATSSITGSANTTVNASSGAVVLSAPATATAGSSFTVTATVKDAFGNVATNYTGTLRFTSTDAQATLPGNYTFTAADAGTKSFSVTLKTAGARTVTATDTVTAAISGSASSTVSAAAASTATVSAPATATAGTSFTATVTLKDAYGNTATGYTGTVRFTSNDTQATLPANYTFTTADAGTKSFTVTLKTAGTRSVTAADVVTSSLTASANTNVTASRQKRTTLTAMGSTSGTQSTLYVYDEAGALRLAALSPFGGTGGLKVAVGDVNNDTYDDVILTPASGIGGGRVMILSGRDFGVLANYTLAPGFAGFAGGVNVAAGDVNGDGTDDVILGAAARSDTVVVLSGATQNALMVKSAFGGVNTGVTVAAGDFDGDGKADVVTGTATSYAFAAVYSGATQQLLFTSLPLGTDYTGGISVAAGDLNGDRRADLVMGLNSFGAVVTVDTATGGSAVQFAYPGQNVGVSVSTTDRNKDGVAEVVTGLVGGLPLVRMFAGPSFAQVAEFYAYQNGLPVARNGVYVAGSARL